jgi:ClpA/ClpB-like protein
MMDEGIGKFDKFTERARKVLSLAQEESQRFNHNYLGTEHLLLGLIRENDGVAAKVLSNLGVELNKVRSAVEFIIGRGDRIVLGDIGLTPRSKKVIELSVDEARRLGHHHIGTEHLLLGLVREGEGIASGVLESLGVNLEKVRAEVALVLGIPLPPGLDLPLYQGPASPLSDGTQDAPAWLPRATPPSASLSSVLTLVCRDVDATVAYYMDYLGASELDYPESTVRKVTGAQRLLRMQFRAPLLALRAAPDGADEAERDVIGAIELNLFTNDCGALWARLQARDTPGVSAILEVPGAADQRMFTLTDPDGRKLRVYGSFNG